MKIIVISGSYSGIGKTTLARNIGKILGNQECEIIKFGHNQYNPTKKEKLFHNIEEGVDYIKALQKKNTINYLIIESNSIYTFIKPDFAVFLKGNNKPEKETAALARKFADIIIDEQFDCNCALNISKEKLGADITQDLLQQHKYLYNK